MTTYTFQSDSVYITNSTAVDSGDTSVTVDNTTTFCVRIHLDKLSWKVKRPLIDIPVPKMEEAAISQVYIIDLGQATQLIQIKGHLYDTTEDSEDTCASKEENMVKLAYNTTPEEGLTLIVPDYDNSSRKVWSEEENDDFYPSFNIKNLEILRDAKDQFSLEDGTRKPKRTVNLEGIVGEKQT